MGTQLNYKSDCRVAFGTYVQAHEEPAPTNSQEPRTMGAISLGPTGNIQGTFEFLNLRTGKKISRRKWTSLPMPQEVIDHVNQLGKADGMPEQLKFYDRDGDPIKSLQAPAPEPEIAGVPAPQTIAPPPQPGITPEPVVASDPDSVPEAATMDQVPPDDSPEPEPPVDVPDDPVPQAANDVLHQPEETESQPEPSAPIENTTEIDPPEPRCSTRTRRAVTRLQPTMRGQHHQETTNVNVDVIEDIEPAVMEHIFTQLS